MFLSIASNEIYQYRGMPVSPNSTFTKKVLPWRAYRLKVETETYRGKDFQFLYVDKREDDKDGHAPRKRLSPEVFNHDLRRVNPDDLDSILRFIDDYGIPFLPYADSKGQFLAGQFVDKKHPFPFDGLVTSREAGVGGDDTGFVNTESCNRGKVLTYFDIVVPLGRATRIALEQAIFQSIYARHECYAKEPERFGGIISLDEVKIGFQLLVTCFQSMALFEWANKKLSHDELIYELDYGKFPVNDWRIFSESWRDKNPQSWISLGRAKEEHIEELARDTMQEVEHLNYIEAKDYAAFYAEEDQNKMLSSTNEAARIFVFNLMRGFDIQEDFGWSGELEYSPLEILVDRRNESGVWVKKQIGSYEFKGSFTEALWDSFVKVFEADGDWVPCAYCGRIHKVSKDSELTTRRRPRASKYCKNSCRVSASTTSNKKS